MIFAQVRVAPPPAASGLKKQMATDRVTSKSVPDSDSAPDAD
jgi:hypothetical protein